MWNADVECKGKRAACKLLGESDGEGIGEMGGTGESNCSAVSLARVGTKQEGEMNAAGASSPLALPER